MRPTVRPGDAKDAAQALELEVCVGRLLTALFPDVPDEPVPWERPGRYPALERAVIADPALRGALLDDDEDSVATAWANRLKFRGLDLALHHTLAVVYREKALALPPDTERAADLLATTTALWTLLLGSRAFWDGQAATGGAPGAEDELRDAVCRELFGLHRKHGSVALRQGESDIADTHLGALDACRAGAAAVRETLEGTRIGWSAGDDKSRWAAMAALAERAIDDWCHETIEHGAEALEDADAVARLPAGITKDFATGLDRVRPLTELSVPLPRLLTTALEWCNEWQMCVYGLKSGQDSRRRQIRSILDGARPFAEDLAESTRPGQSHLRENQALSRHFMFRGFVADTAESAIREYEKALEWNPHNANAEKLLEDQRSHEAIGAAVDEAVRQLEAGRARLAMVAVQRIAHLPEAREDVRSLTCAIHVRLALDALDDDDFAGVERELNRATTYAASAEEEASILVYRALGVLRQAATGPPRLAAQRQVTALGLLRKALQLNPPDHLVRQIHQLAPHLRYR
ncbi:hypothetical protein [Streptomyces litchfieldiae]|uniref:Tetratricopeptide repeat protein n=1 Tax=Streptomyces litchfieldiae TaxID=3075543 RepID=A0ABU2MKG5_9ACTN|nr:hypothetical protein [Streptomyces sp. DSM 44938]MDT0341985.1 hypothetical protein [Streptomyces sp. DSM 44938]